MEVKKKKPTIKTLEDEGKRVDLLDFGNGRQALFYKEKMRVAATVQYISTTSGAEAESDKVSLTMMKKQEVKEYGEEESKKLEAIIEDWKGAIADQLQHIRNLQTALSDIEQMLMKNQDVKEPIKI